MAEYGNLLCMNQLGYKIFRISDNGKNSVFKEGVTPKTLLFNGLTLLIEHNNFKADKYLEA